MFYQDWRRWYRIFIEIILLVVAFIAGVLIGRSNPSKAAKLAAVATAAKNVVEAEVKKVKGK